MVDIPDSILQRHTAQEWVGNAFEILLAHALLGRLPYLADIAPREVIAIRILEPLQPSFAWEPGTFPQTLNCSFFELSRNQIHNINVIRNLTITKGFRFAADYLCRCLPPSSYSRVSEFYLALKCNRFSGQTPLSSSRCTTGSEIAMREEAAERSYRCSRETLDRNVSNVLRRNMELLTSAQQVFQYYDKDKKKLDNCCRSCGRKVPLTAGLCEPCQKVESLMSECFETNPDLSTHKGQRYEEGITGGVD